MGCKSTKIESRETHIRQHNNGKTMRDNEDMFYVDTRAEVLKQLEEDGTVTRTTITGGGVSFGINLDGGFDENLNVTRTELPSKLLERLKRNMKEVFDKEERDIMASILRADDLKCKEDKARLSSEKQAIAKQRRDNWELLKREKYKQKLQYIEEVRQKKKQMQQPNSPLSDTTAVS